MRRKYKPKLRFKRKKEIAVRVLFLLFIAGIAAASPSLYGTVRKSLSAAMNFSRERISSVNADFRETSLNAEVKKYLSSFIGQKFDEKSEKSVYAYLSARYPFVTGLKIERSSVTGSLSVSGVLERPVAKIKDSADLYMLESGKLARNQAQQGEFLSVACRSDCSFGADFASFIMKLKETADKKGFDLEGVSYEGKNSSPVVFLQDSNEINWGDYRFTEEKFDRIRSVFEDLKGKSEGPFRIDLRFFDSGKIVVSAKK